MKNLAANAEASVLKLMIDLGQSLRDEGISSNVQYVELDARVELKDTELPPTDVIGMTQFSISEPEEKLWAIHFIVGLSTLGDENLFRLKAMANVVYDRFPCGAMMTYYDNESTEPRTWIKVIPGTVMLPTHRVETRPFRFIQVQALLDPYEGARRELEDPVP